MNIARTTGIVFVTLFALGCGGSGMGKAVRTDISNQMNTANEPISKCYADALEQDPQLSGRMLLSFKVAADTGQFEGVAVSRDNLRNEGLKACVLTAVSALKLEKPQKTAVSTEYPIEFESQ